MEVRFASTALATLALAAVLFLVSRDRPPMSSSAETREGQVSSVPAEVDAREIRAREPVMPGGELDPERGASASAPAPTTARDFLQEYWGDQWAGVEKAMLDAGLNLDGPYVFHPWEEAERLLRPAYRVEGARARMLFDAVVDWEEEPTVASFTELARGMHVPAARMPREEDLPALEEVARPFNDELRRYAQDWVDGLRFAVEEKWGNGDFVRAPFATWGSPGASETGFYGAAHGALGWGTMLVLKREDYPYLVEIADRTADLRDQRDAAIRQYLLQR